MAGEAVTVANMNGMHDDEPSDTSSDSSPESVDTSPSGDVVPPPSAISGPVVVRIGAAIMVLSSLLSWGYVGGDGFPHVTGIGGNTFGTGLAIFVLGLSLLFRDWPIGVILGSTLGAFSVTVVFIWIIDPSSGHLDAGPWVALVGAAVAAVGGVLVAVGSFDRAELELVGPFQAGLGAVLAIAAAIWFDWVFWPVWGLFVGFDDEPNGIDAGLVNGLDPDVPFGIPVLILASVALLLVAGVVVEFFTNGKLVPLIIQVAGVSIAVVAGANALGGVIVGWSLFGSAPFVALAGGILLTSAVRESDS